MKRLIVTADDVGLHRGMTAGAIRAHRDGIVTACSIVANGAAFDDAIEQLRATPSLEAGVHLALVEERALSTGAAMPKSYVQFLVARVSDTWIERELRMQIEKVLATGLRVTHLNGHQHLHLWPRVFRIVRRLAEEYRIGYVRIVDDRGGRAPLARRLSIAALSYLGRHARDTRTNVHMNAHTIGVAEAGHLVDVARLFDDVEGITELVTHPGIGDAELASAYTWRYAWDAETRALCEPGLRDQLARRGITLIAPSAAG